MLQIKYFSLFLIITSSTVHCKVYKRCEFIQELIEKYNFKDEHAAKVSCIAEGALFDTSRINYHWVNLEFGFQNYKPNYGIFQISSEIWCSETGNGGICNINCKDLTNDDLSDDVECLRKIISDTDLNEENWNLPWIQVIGSPYECVSNSYLNNCTAYENINRPWTSLDDCVEKFPEFFYPFSGFGFGGKPALQHEFPHAAAIGWTQDDSNIRWSCGGSLISEDTILTAAHCTYDRSQKEPDVVRLGDLNLVTDDDVNEAQQYEVASIIRHPEYKQRYNDIALIKLKSKVNITLFVIPACLWTSLDIPRNIELEACGFGQTEFLGDISPILIKVIVTPTDMEECKEYYPNDRLLKEGLVERIHLCADDKTGNNMDTCEGDSGGPLEMKLLHKDTFVPFIVGITAFGKGCGFGSPGVYTRISSYTNWIKQHVSDIELDPQKCGKKNKDLRYSKIDYGSTEFEPKKTIIGENPLENTTASIISDSFLITTATQLKKINNPKAAILNTNSSQIPIEQIFYHPKYVQGNAEYDLALIKLKSKVRWYYHDHPTCVGSENIGNDAYQTQKYNDIDIKFDSVRSVKISNEIENCHTFSKKDTFYNNSSNSFVCFQNSDYHVPGVCQVPYGSPIIRKHFSVTHPRATFVKGLTVQGNDCTFTLALNTSKHYDWMNSIIFNSPETRVDSNDNISEFNFQDFDLIPGDVCVQHNGQKGVCKDMKECDQKTLTKNMLLCSRNTVCC